MEAQVATLESLRQAGIPECEIQQQAALLAQPHSTGSDNPVRSYSEVAAQPKPKPAAFAGKPARTQQTLTPSRDFFESQDHFPSLGSDPKSKR